MTIKRAAIAAFMSVSMVMTLAACGPAENAGTPRPVDESPSADGKSSGETRSAEFPSEPKVAIEWQNTVVDVEPTSRLRSDPGGPDLAHVRTLLLLEEPPDGETEEFLKNLEGTETEIDGRRVRMTYTFEVEEQDEDEYAFEIQGPVEFAEMDKNDDLSVVVLLPREARDYENGPTYGIRLEGPQDESEEDGLVVLQAEEAPGRRITLGLYERQDPDLPPIYRYIPL